MKANSHVTDRHRPTLSHQITVRHFFSGILRFDKCQLVKTSIDQMLTKGNTLIWQNPTILSVAICQCLLMRCEFVQHIIC